MATNPRCQKRSQKKVKPEQAEVFSKEELPVIRNDTIQAKPLKEAREIYKGIFGPLLKEDKSSVLKICVQELFPVDGKQEFSYKNGVMDVSLSVKTPIKIRIDFTEGRILWGGSFDSLIEIRAYREQILAACLIAMSSKVLSIYSQECYFCISALSCFHTGQQDIFKIPNYSFEKFVVAIEKVMNLEMNLQGLGQLQLDRQSVASLLGISKNSLAIIKTDFEGNANFRNLQYLTKYNTLKYADGEEIPLLSEMNIDDVKNIPWCSYLHNNAFDRIHTHLTSSVMKNHINPYKFIKYLNDNAEFFFGCVVKNNVDQKVNNLIELIDYHSQSQAMNLEFAPYPSPESIKERHDRVSSAFEIKKDEILNNRVESRYNLENSIVEAEYKEEDNVYTLELPKNVVDFLLEHKHQGHCIKSYAERHSKSQTHILFIRKNGVPYITLEVRSLSNLSSSSNIIQAKKKSNAEPNNTDRIIMQNLFSQQRAKT